MASSAEGEPRIGANVRAARRSRGMSLETLAGLAGRSKGWLSKIENSHARLERRQDIAALAEALGVSADSLVGEPAPDIRPRTRGYDFEPLRAALLDASLDDPADRPARPPGVLAELTEGQDAALRRADYDTMTRQLPGLLGELQVQAATGDGQERELALRLLVQACASAMIMLRHFGLADLAWVSADRGRQAAGRLGDPVWAAAAAFECAQARPAANKSQPLLAAARRADDLSRTSAMTGSPARSTGCSTCPPPWPAPCKATTAAPAPARTATKRRSSPGGWGIGRMPSSCSAPPTSRSGAPPRGRGRQRRRRPRLRRHRRPPPARLGQPARRTQP